MQPTIHLRVGMQVSCAEIALGCDGVGIALIGMAVIAL